MKYFKQDMRDAFMLCLTVMIFNLRWFTPDFKHPILEAIVLFGLVYLCFVCVDVILAFLVFILRSVVRIWVE
jgi:hypothetical protein